ncbi:type II CRISPR RNA-guided endonuclease Cas9 [Shinella daejeonensis]|uniref:type II CRISPR RNA-guided endonuclease Cas9 n=1 Tax=Shinella daejeonensis TaxID=659017 RepID=UPI0020C82694|nr:type II CRISPR RNA-guided endonuclease Cas9 [Shinella daejeonensis]MCP8894562.1 type II CRISPR RNA-guided endonuclease Cas9 [Shinella daejeonensis]
MAGRITTLGLDLGTNSLGWAIIETRGEPGESDEGRIVASGVRIFSQSEMAGRDPQSKASLAVARRQARGSRRRRDRYLKRRQRLVDLLVDLGLMPAAEGARAELVKNHGDGKAGDLSSSVYALRARALDEALSPHEIGRAIFHLNQRRGFKSNRKADSNDPEQGVISEGMRALDEKMAEAGARTIGEWLHMRRLQGLPVRARIAPDGEGYAFYPSRGALEREFDRIMARQTLFHPELLTDAAIGELRAVVFHQRPLRPVKPGKCSYNPLEERLPKAHPLFQKFRLLKELNELEIVGEDQKHIKLTPEERNTLALQLRTSLNKQGKVPFSKLRSTLKLGREVRFNKEADNRSDLEGDVIHFRMSRPECFGNRWAELPVEAQASITEKLRTEPDYNTLMNWLKTEAGLDEAHARAVADTPVPDGFGRLGRSALTALIDALENDVGEGGFVITEAEAAKRVYGRTNSEADPNRKGVDQLPKYQEVLARHIPPGTGEPDDPYDDSMGRITNPTVHIALNQLRRVVNALIRTYGKPDRIAIEVGRELKMNDRERDEVNRRIGRNTRAAIERGKKLTETFRQLDTGYNRLRLELWEDLNQKPENRVCIYCGKAIAGHMLFNGETDIDHILPYSKTLDDSKANRILCCTSCNREKKNRPPSSVPQWRSRYDAILARVTTLPKNKQWRFGEDAMARFGEEEGFLARQLTDMQYISRLALTYLAHLYPVREEKLEDKTRWRTEAGLDGQYRKHARIRALPGRMTEMLRRQWSLNELLHGHNLIGGDMAKPKNRLDHRHHAIDAIVIACTSRALIQRLATASAAAEERGAERVVERIDPPWASFREDVRAAVSAIVVSHKPDHGTVSREGDAKGRGQTAGKLHNDTAYGYTGEKDAVGNDIVVRRIAITDIRSRADIMKIRTNAHGHSELRDRLYEATRGLEGKAFEQAVLDFVRGDAKFKGIRHVRIAEAANPVWITHGGGRHRKGYLPGGNDRFDVWELADGKWDAEVVTTFDAHRPGFVPRMRLENHNARKIMSLKKGDMVAYDDPGSGKRIIAIVRKFDQRNKQLYLDAHNEAGNLDKREKEKTYKPLRPRPNPLKEYRPRQVRIDEIGQVFDPGPWWEKQGG